MACDRTQTNATLIFDAGSFAPEYCPANYQALANDIANALTGTLPGTFSAIIAGSTTPAEEDKNKVWVKLDPTTCAPLGVYVWSPTYGAWVKEHPDFEGKVIMYEGAEGDVATLDGGDANPIGPSTGPMWEIVTEMAARFPVGPGTFPGYESTPVPVVVPVDGQGGADGQPLVLTANQLPVHKHKIGTESAGDDESGPSEAGQLRVSGGSLHWENNAGVHIGYTRNQGESEAINIPTLPPYRAIYFLRKSARRYYTA